MPRTDLDEDAQLAAAVAVMIGHTGAEDFELRYCEPEDGRHVQVIVWVAIAAYSGDRFETAAGITPGQAAWRLGEALIDGGRCTRCLRPTALSEGEDDLTDLAHNPFIRKRPDAMPLCQYRYRGGKIIRGCDSMPVGTR